MGFAYRNDKWQSASKQKENKDFKVGSREANIVCGQLYESDVHWWKKSALIKVMILELFPDAVQMKYKKMAAWGKQVNFQVFHNIRFYVI